MQHLLIAKLDGELAGRIRLDPSRAYSIGRSPRCDIGLRPRSISRRHALLVPFAGRWLVLDTGSRLGLRTSAGNVRRADLGEARWVGIGPLTLGLDRGIGLAGSERDDDASGAPLGRFPSQLGAAFPPRWEPADSASGRRRGFHPANPFEETVLAASGPGMRMDGVATPVPANDGPLLVVEREGTGFEALYACREANFATVGFDPLCRIQLAAAAGLAALHLVLYREPRAWVAVDAGGGVVASGKRYIRKRLDDDRPLQLGPYRIRLARATPLDATPQPVLGFANRSQGAA